MRTPSRFDLRRFDFRRAAKLSGCLWFAVGLAATPGCAAEVAHGLDEGEANRMLVALNEHGVAASKAPDPVVEGKFVLTVPRGDLGSAVATLSQEGLPTPSSPGVLESLGDTGLVASRKAEHARLVVGTAGELERSLTAVAGVLSARVHLAVPEADPFAPRDAVVPTSASVLIRHQGATPPLSASDVQRLVAGAVSGLSPEQVAVVHLPVAAAAVQARDSFAQFGPLSVSHGSISALRLIVIAVAGLNLALLGALIFLWIKLRGAKVLPARSPATSARVE